MAIREVKLTTYAVTITAHDTIREREIYSATFKAFANSGSGGHTDQLPMYGKDKKPITHMLSAVAGQPESETWLIQAQNVVETSGPLFYAEDLINLVADQGLRFVVVKANK